MPLTVALQQFQLQDNWPRFTWVVVISVPDILKSFRRLIPLWKMIGLLRSCARQNTLIDSFMASLTTLLLDMYSSGSAGISLHHGCPYQNGHNFVKSCWIWTILVSLAFLIYIICKFGITMVSTLRLGSPGTSFPSAPNVHVFMLVLCRYLMDRFPVFCDVQRRVPAFQQFLLCGKRTNIESWRTTEAEGPPSPFYLYLISSWGSEFLLCYCAHQNAIECSYPLVPISHQSNTYCMTSSRISMDPSPLHLSPYSFEESYPFASARY
jgi:hypothetical protein